MNDEKIISRDALPDERPMALREQDYSILEIAGVGVTKLFEHEQITKPTATEFNQWYVGSCVPHGHLTMLEYEGIATPDISRLRLYRKRINYPSAGCNGVDIFNQIKTGQSNDFETPERFREVQANAMPYVLGVKILKDFRYYQYIDKKTGAILHDDVVSGVANGKSVSIFIYATDDEWSEKYVELKENIANPWSAGVRHCVAIVPEGDFTKDGKRWLTVQDSAKFGGRGLRHVEFDTFFKTRCYLAATAYAVGEVPTPPIKNEDDPFTYCELGDRNEAVLALQTFLVKEGKLEDQYTTGYYGALTAKAVLWWQLEHWELFTSDIPQLLEWGGKYWGDQSIKVYKEVVIK